MGILPVLLWFSWVILIYVQVFLSYGTAYRLTKYNGDNGLSLFGWHIVTGLASLVPGLGIYLWMKYSEENMRARYGHGYPPPPPGYPPQGYQAPPPPPQEWTCNVCGTQNTGGYCTRCDRSR